MALRSIQNWVYSAVPNQGASIMSTSRLWANRRRGAGAKMKTEDDENGPNKTPSLPLTHDNDCGRRKFVPYISSFWRASELLSRFDTKLFTFLRRDPLLAKPLKNRLGPASQRRGHVKNSFQTNTSTPSQVAQLLKRFLIQSDPIALQRALDLLNQR